MSKAFNLMTAEQFAKLCDSVMKAQRKTDDDLQKLAIAAIAYSIQHGDVQPANRLFNAMQRSLRRDSMVKFLETHGQLAWITAEKKFQFFKVENITFDHEKLAALKWYEAKKEAAIVSEYDLVAEFDKFLKRVTKMVEDKSVVVKDGGLFNYLTNASAEYHAAAHVTAADGE